MERVRWQQLRCFLYRTARWFEHVCVMSIHFGSTVNTHLYISCSRTYLRMVQLCHSRTAYTPISRQHEPFFQCHLFFPICNLLGDSWLESKQFSNLLRLRLIFLLFVGIAKMNNSHFIWCKIAALHFKTCITLVW